ncbi:hypothetical protein CJD36_006060 [Flavipsychrobacter stenotrophus]|uniref:HTTM-like domain-containing protein n=1 Tax=Flavipsychrobacter stenotrophus TaxID=2077091 RepID=A0A2S7SWR6_9BACT|nr:hypothetical protein [Flavipsychrobacter stenotrophus]PQJ11363.1 hypothetical protein CJD36_006060 [Flavipsychrobacter stenotrophus]
MMDKLITYLKNKQVHTPRIALARLLLALGMLLTILCNDMSIVANHNYKRLPEYSAKHSSTISVPLKQLDLFMVMPPGVAKGVVVVILLLVMTGFYPKVTGVLHFIACFSYHNYFLIVNGGDEITFVMSLLLLPLCLSDPRKNQWRHVETTASQGNIVGNIALLMIQVQAAYIYFNAGYTKLFSRVWREGTAVFYYTSHYRLGATFWLQQINELVTRTPLVKVLSWGVLAFELLLALCLFFSEKIKRKFFIPALIFHGLIVINFGLISFFFAMAGMLVLYLGGSRKS